MRQKKVTNQITIISFFIFCATTSISNSCILHIIPHILHCSILYIAYTGSIYHKILVITKKKNNKKYIYYKIYGLIYGGLISGRAYNRDEKFVSDLMGL